MPPKNPQKTHEVDNIVVEKQSKTVKTCKNIRFITG